MSRIAQNLIRGIKETKKETFTQEEIFKLVNDIVGDNEVKIIETDDIKLNRLDMTITFKGKKTHLSKLEFNLLAYLIENRGEIINRNILMRDIWGNDVCGTLRTIDVCICKLRNIIGKGKIKTVKKVGYCFVD